MKTYLVDSFTNEAFKGNPAGVCILDGDLSADKMLLIAQELGLSETAFIRKQEAENAFSIRYFSQKMEIPLCGHATLAAAKVVFEKMKFPEIYFHTTQSLELHIGKLGTEIVMHLPVYGTVPSDVPDRIINALGIADIHNDEYNH